MTSILIVGTEDDFFVNHLYFWFRMNNIEAIITDDPRQWKNRKIDLLIFMMHPRQETIYVNGVKETTVFNLNYNFLHDALMLNYNHLLFLDHTYRAQAPNLLYRTYYEINQKIIKDMSYLLEKKYSVIYMYDTIGYKYLSFGNWTNDIQMLMEHSFPKGMKKLEIQSNYNNIHFVYIMDAIKAITEIVRYYLANGVFLHSEEHIRYDNNGTSIKNIVTLFEKVNQIEFKEKNIITLESTAPYHGAPSTFLNNFNTDKKFWTKVRREPLVEPYLK